MHSCMFYRVLRSTERSEAWTLCFDALDVGSLVAVGLLYSCPVFCDQSTSAEETFQCGLFETTTLHLESKQNPRLKGTHQVVWRILANQGVYLCEGRHYFSARRHRREAWLCQGSLNRQGLFGTVSHSLSKHQLTPQFVTTVTWALCSKSIKKRGCMLIRSKEI